MLTINISARIASGVAALGLASAQAALAAPVPPAAAPLGVFGIDTPPKGKFVITLQGSVARLRDNQIGTHRVSPSGIVANIVSPATPVGPHLLRMVPKNLAAKSEAISIAYGASKDLTLALSTALIQKDVGIETYKGLTGPTPLGYSVGKTSGIGDTTVAAIGHLYQDSHSRVMWTVGVSLPTGSTTRTMSVLVPDGTRPAKRAFYAMQPGTGTVDLMPGIAYAGSHGPWSWGASYRARLPLGRNSEGWAYGDLHEVNAWSGYTLPSGIEATVRVNATTQGRIEGQDPQIRGFAQGSNPAFYGGRQASLYLGAIMPGKLLRIPAAQLGIEAGVPLYQDLNGPQLRRDWQLTVAARYRF